MKFGGNPGRFGGLDFDTAMTRLAQLAPQVQHYYELKDRAKGMPYKLSLILQPTDSQGDEWRCGFCLFSLSGRFAYVTLGRTPTEAAATLLKHILDDVLEIGDGEDPEEIESLPDLSSIPRKGEVYQHAETGEKRVVRGALSAAELLEPGWSKVADRPHGDGDFSYLCGSPSCRCSS